MSLLMKALEKAAQDRNKTPAAAPYPVAAATAKAAGRELSLESVELKSGIKADEMGRQQYDRAVRHITPVFEAFDVDQRQHVCF